MHQVMMVMGRSFFDSRKAYLAKRLSCLTTGGGASSSSASTCGSTGNSRMTCCSILATTATASSVRPWLSRQRGGGGNEVRDAKPCLEPRRDEVPPQQGGGNQAKGKNPRQGAGENAAIT